MSDRLREAPTARVPRPCWPPPEGCGALATGAQEGAYGPASWIQGLGAWSRTDGDGNAAALKRSSGGFLMGLDAPLAQTWRVGVMAGYSRSDFDVNDRASSGRSDNYHLGAYGGGQWGAPARRRGLQLARHRHRRSVAMPGFSDRLKAGYDGRSAQAYADLSYRIDLSAVALEPFVNLAYVNLRTGGYRESGGAAALHAQARRARRSSRPWARGPRRASNWAARRPRWGSLGWRHATGDVKPRAAQAFSEGESFTVAGVALARNSAVIEAGLDLQATRKTRVGLAYQGLLSGSARDHGVRANLTVRFRRGRPRRPGGASRPYTRAVARIQPSRKSSGSSSICSSVCASRGKSTHVVDGIRIVREGDDLPRPALRRGRVVQHQHQGWRGKPGEGQPAFLEPAVLDPRVARRGCP